MKESKEKKLHFALDIGTRNVVGILFEKGDKGILYHGHGMVEHPVRSMLDGMIQDVEEVTRVVKRIREELEAVAGYPLNTASVAVAGRALMTQRGEASMKVQPREITPEEVRLLELAAIQEAQNRLLEQYKQFDDYYCVGYSTQRFLLDGFPIKNLVGQRGETIGTELISTFLPKTVVDSMYAVLERSGLDVEMINLEPIVALEFVVPEDIRRLNILLLDVGAGTSDIALTRDGAVFGYGMVPIAGDEVTECLVDRYLVHFDTAERLKKFRPVNDQETIEFEDILGQNHTVSYQEISATIGEVAERIAGQVHAEVMHLNQKAPEVVMLVGGGALTPGLADHLCDKFDLSKSRVAVRYVNSLRRIENLPENLSTPEFITPFAIAHQAVFGRGFRFKSVYVNGALVRVLELVDHIQLKDALIAAGFSMDRLKGKIGRSLSLEVNGRIRLVKGKVGPPPGILLNDAEANLDQQVEEGDRIEIKEGLRGEDALITCRELLQEEGIHQEWSLLVNGRPTTVRVLVMLNGRRADLDEPIKDRAVVQVKTVQGVQDLLEYLDAGLGPNSYRHVRIRTMAETLEFRKALVDVTVNGMPATLTTHINDGDRVDWKTHQAAVSVQDILHEAGIEAPSLNLTVNDRPFTLQLTPAVRMHGKLVQLTDMVTEDTDLDVESTANRTPILSDVLKEYPIDPQKRQGTLLRMQVNGQPAGFTTVLNPGDSVKIFFE